MPSLTSGIYMHYMVQTCKRVTPSQYSTRELFIYQDAVGLGNLFAISCPMNKVLLGVRWRQKLSTHMKLNEKLTQGNHLEKYVCHTVCQNSTENEHIKMRWTWIDIDDLMQFLSLIMICFTRNFKNSRNSRVCNVASLIILLEYH